MPIPVYLKTDANMPRPTDSEFYYITRNGTFLCRNHTFFSSDVKTYRGPASLAAHEERCVVTYPRLAQAALEFIVAFFHLVFRVHGSEAVVLLLWDLKAKRYRLWVPEQKPTVWESAYGTRTAMDVTYEVPVALPENCLLVGDIHSHADLAAYASQRDRHDEEYRDGVHLVVGRVNQEPPDFHLEFAVDGQRFLGKLEQLVRSYQKRRRIVPSAWMNQVHPIVKRSVWSSWRTGYGGQNGYQGQSDLGGQDPYGAGRPGSSNPGSLGTGLSNDIGGGDQRGGA